MTWAVFQFFLVDHIWMLLLLQRSKMLNSVLKNTLFQPCYKNLEYGGVNFLDEQLRMQCQ